MKNSIKNSLLVLFMVFACSPSSEPSYDHEDGLDAFSESTLERHIATLSSDEFMGRKPFTEGETKTLEYLQEQFRAVGLEPGNGNSYLQEVPLVSITTEAEQQMLVEGPVGDFELKGFDDYVIWTLRTEEEIRLDGDEVVFAGFGAHAPEYGWNDFEGVDVKDKIILVFVNDPGFGSGDTTLFRGNTMTYYGRWTYKFEEAARRGARGCLVIHDEIPASYGFWVLQNSWNTSNLYLASDQYKCPVVGWVTKNTAKKLFEAAGMDYDQKFAEAHSTEFKAEPMDLKLSTSMQVSTKYDKSDNVIGIIRGSTRPEEFILYTAHWDHLGIGNPDASGDSIYNGALDNASGTAGLIELANAFNSMRVRPERSVVFLALTAEEQGLLGAEYYADNPVFPKEQTVANINMDGINPFGRMKDIILVGKGQSDLEDYLMDEAEKVGRYVANETTPEAGYYFRSDHFCFARIGIPALFTETGIDLEGQGKEAGKRLNDDYVDNRYHQPSDEYVAEEWRLDGAIDDLKLLFQVGKRLSFETTWPGWKEGSEFKAIREGYMK